MAGFPLFDCDKKNVWFLHHNGGGRVESLVKNDNAHKGGFAVRQDVLAALMPKVGMARFAINPAMDCQGPIALHTDSKRSWHMNVFKQ